MKTLKQKLADQVTAAREALQEAKDEQNLWELYAEALDELPVPEGAEKTGTSFWCWREQFHASIFYTTKSIPAFLGLLERLEEQLGETWTSEDTPDGMRLFKIAREDLSLTLFLTPDVKGTCQKILIGQDTMTETRQINRYALKCA